MRKTAMNLMCLSSIFMGLLYMQGCMEIEEYPEARFSCMCESLQNEARHTESILFEGKIPESGYMDFVKTTSDENCDGLLTAVKGTWKGLGDYSDRIFRMTGDGHYTLEMETRGRWRLVDSGEYWIEYVMYHGLLRTELHINFSDAEDYAVRYRIENGILHLEDGGESKMEFERYAEMDDNTKK